MTDAMIQAEVKNYITQHGGAIDDSAIYEVFLPDRLLLQARQRDFVRRPAPPVLRVPQQLQSYTGHDVKYSSMPQPSCGGCQWTGWTTAQNFEHFGTHETREAVTDAGRQRLVRPPAATRPTTSAPGLPAPFIGTGGFGYQ